MSMENLLLSQQMQTTANNLRNVMGIESDRQRRAGLFSGGGSLIGGGLGLLAGLALAPATGGASLLSLAKFGGAGAGVGSLVGSGIGTFLGGSRRGDATDIGMNTNIISGREKEFSQSVKDRYNTSISDFQDNLNTRILTDALKSGIQGAAFSAMNPMLVGKIQSTTRNVLGMQPASLGATTASLGTTPANLTAAQEYNPFSNNLNRSNPLNYEPLDPTSINDLSILSGATPAPSSDPTELYLSQLSDTSASSTGTVGPDQTLPFSNIDISAPGEVDFIGPMQGSPTTSNTNMNQGNNFFNLIMRRLMGATPTVQAPGINQNQNIAELQRLSGPLANPLFGEVQNSKPMMDFFMRDFQDPRKKDLKESVMSGELVPREALQMLLNMQMTDRLRATGDTTNVLFDRLEEAGY